MNINQSPNNSETIDIDWGLLALAELLSNYDFNTVLDIGSGDGSHSNIFKLAGKEVTSIDKYSGNADFSIDFLDFEAEKKYDCIFCSHVIEHQRNCGLFLDKIYSMLKDDGILCILGPCHSDRLLIEGHLKTWTAAIALQNLTMAGFDCSNSFIYQYHETGIICKKSLNFDKTNSSYKFINLDLWPHELPKANLMLSNEDGYFFSENFSPPKTTSNNLGIEQFSVKIKGNKSKEFKPFIVKSSRHFKEDFIFLNENEH